MSKFFLLYALVETDAGTTASTVLRGNAEARTAKGAAIGESHLPRYTDGQLMGVLLTGQHSCGILTHRINSFVSD